jgi:hypothetical protein
MNRVLTALLVLVPAVAFAAPPAAGPSHAPDPVKRERMEKRMQTAMTIGLANALDLDAPRALALQQAMAPFNERRKPIHEQLKHSKEIIERAADGDPAVAGQVDLAIQQAFDARAQLEQIDREMLLAVSHDLPAQQKAKLSVFLAEFKHEMMERMARGEHGEKGREHHGER